MLLCLKNAILVKKPQQKAGINRPRRHGIFAFENISRYLPPSLVLREIAWRYYWHGEAEVRLLRQLVRPNCNVVDVGAASGNYTYHLSRLSPRVYAFEPNPVWVRWLRRCSPRNVTIFDVALADSSGNATLSIPQDRDGISLEAATLGDNFPPESCERIPVQQRTLDEYNLDNVGFIKIDVEGHEMAVLRGAQRTLERSRPVLLVEVIAKFCRLNLSTALNEIEQLGYEGSFLLEGRLQPSASINPEKHQPDVHFLDRTSGYVSNFIFMPR
jgi:FkbM family methyltransferase